MDLLNLKNHPLHFIANAFLLFMLFSCAGWCYETINDFIVQGGFHWRSSLVGPWCPIYGIGGLLIVWIFEPVLSWLRVKKLNPILSVVILACGIYLLVTVVELVGSYACEAGMGYMPWDYSSSWGNFEGRIAPEFTIRFVIGGLVFLYFLEPWVCSWTEKHPEAALAIALVLLGVFIADNILESAGVWKEVVPRDAEVFVK